MIKKKKKKPAGKRLQARPAGQVSSQGAHPSPEDTMKTTCDKKVTSTDKM